MPSPHPIQRVAVFCGSSSQLDTRYLDLAERVGRHLAESGIEVVYGGGATGLMGATARGAMAAGGSVIGVLPDGLFGNGVTAEQVTSLELVADMHERKSRMYALADGFVGLPGGMGTLEEVFEAATWTQLDLHAAHKHVVLLAENDFWAPIRALLNRAHGEGFMKTATRDIVRFASSIDEVLPHLR